MPSNRSISRSSATPVSPTSSRTSATPPSRPSTPIEHSAIERNQAFSNVGAHFEENDNAHPWPQEEMQIRPSPPPFELDSNDPRLQRVVAGRAFRSGSLELEISSNDSAGMSPSHKDAGPPPTSPHRDTADMAPSSPVTWASPPTTEGDPDWGRSPPSTTSTSLTTPLSRNGSEVSATATKRIRSAMPERPRSSAENSPTPRPRTGKTSRQPADKKEI